MRGREKLRVELEKLYGVGNVRFIGGVPYFKKVSPGKTRGRWFPYQGTTGEKSITEHVTKIRSKSGKALKSNPVQRAMNTLKNLNASELEEIIHHLRKGREELADANDMEEALEVARTKYQHWTGLKDARVDACNFPRHGVVYQLGRLKAVIYEAELDGEVNDYIHEFSRPCQPQLAVSSDGSQLYIVGGRYEVTNRGIENRPRKS